jgi:Cysteine-rich secretory protein family
MLARPPQHARPKGHTRGHNGSVPDAKAATRIRRKYRVVALELDERRRRQWAAAEARDVGWGGGRLVARATELSRPTIIAGLPAQAQYAAGPCSLAAFPQEMAAYSFMEHQGRDGSTPAQRATRAGYRWTVVGENVAAGHVSAEEVMAGWLASSEHCANIMSAQFSEMGVAFVVNGQDDYGVYWTLSLAAPR